MNKREFLDDLAAHLASLPKIEADKSIAFYNEMIDDRVEDGMTEEEAVGALGDTRAVAQSIMQDMSLPALMKAKVSESREKAKNRGLWLTLMILGFPLWFPLLMAFAAVTFAVYAVVWAVIVTLYAVVISLGAACAAGLIGGVMRIFVTSMPLGLCIIGAGLVCGALCLFLYKPVLQITKALIRFTARSMRKIKTLIITGKGVAR